MVQRIKRLNTKISRAKKTLISVQKRLETLVRDAEQTRIELAMAMVEVKEFVTNFGLAMPTSPAQRSLHELTNKKESMRTICNTLSQEARGYVHTSATGV